MNELSITMAKLSGIRQALTGVMEENVSRNRSRGELLTRSHYAPESVGHYFKQASSLIDALRAVVPDLYGDFQSIDVEPSSEMAPDRNGAVPKHFSRAQLERLTRDIDQVFEIRANSELEQPKQPSPNCVFISL